MKKFFTFAAAMLMLSASAGTLSLYDGTSYSPMAPFNGPNSWKVDTKTQVLYPAADLTAMVGQEITAITFYTESEGLTLNGGLMNISLGETDATVMTDYITEGMTQVGTCTFTMTPNQVVEYTITFATPYLYKGGNLIFESLVVEAAEDDYCYWTGVETNYNNCVVYSFGTAFRQFLPKTTFTYGGETPEPGLRGDVDGDGQTGIADVTALIDILVSGAEGPAVAYCDEDGEAGIADVTALVDFLRSGAWN